MVCICKVANRVPTLKTLAQAAFEHAFKLRGEALLAERGGHDQLPTVDEQWDAQWDE